jgi:hypothetical protein
MGTFPSFPAGHIPDEDEYGALLDLEIIKPSDEPRTSTTTLANDSALTLTTMVASATYDFYGHIVYSCAASGGTPGMKTNFTAPSGATMTNFCFILNGSIGISANGTVNGVSPGSTSSQYMGFRGTLVMSTTTGAFTFQWAQNTSSASATTIKAGSYLLLHRII